MKYIFFGTPEFADIILKKLIDLGLAPSLVVCNPDRPVGRKKIITLPPTKITAQKHGIGTWQPEKLELDTCRAKFAGADSAIVAAYAKIIPLDILKLFPAGIIGIHPSLLPKYRGSSPIQAAILGGDDKTGVALFLLDERVDRGPIIAARELVISGMTYSELYKKLAELGGNLITEILPKFLKGEIGPQKQNESEATYTKKFIAEDAFVDIKDLDGAGGGDKPMALAIDRKIRALNPEPGVWTLKNGKRVKLLAAEIKDGRLILRKIQIEGEKPRQLAQD